MYMDVVGKFGNPDYLPCTSIGIINVVYTVVFDDGVIHKTIQHICI
jgi:hypothetical protein